MLGKGMVSLSYLMVFGAFAYVGIKEIEKEIAAKEVTKKVEEVNEDYKVAAEIIHGMAKKNGGKIKRFERWES